MPSLPTPEKKGKLLRLGIFCRYRLQFQAISSASAVFFAGGLKLGWSVFERPTVNSQKLIATHLLTIAWFVGVAAGSVLASAFVQRVSKNLAHYLSGVFLVLGGILFICAPTTFASLLCSCLLEGCAYGINQIQGIVTAGEVAHKHIRGLLVSSERIFLWLGICLQLLCTRLWFSMEPDNGYALHVNQLHGFVVILIALAALVLNITYRFESPLLLQMQQRDLAATYVMKRLQEAPYPCLEIVQKREECKQLVEYDAGQTVWMVMRKSNALPLLKLLLLRCYGTISLSLPVNRTFITASITGLKCTINCVYLLAICGVFGSILGALCVDKYGRRNIAVISLLFSGTCAFLMGGILHYIYEKMERPKATFPSNILSVFEDIKWILGVDSSLGMRLWSMILNQNRRLKRGVNLVPKRVSVQKSVRKVLASVWPSSSPICGVRPDVCHFLLRDNDVCWCLTEIRTYVLSEFRMVVTHEAIWLRRPQSVSLLKILYALGVKSPNTLHQNTDTKL